MRLIGFLIVVGLLAAIWELAWGLSGLPRMGPGELRRRLTEGWRPLLLDVRTPAEYRWFHIPGAVNAPFGTSEFDTALRLNAGREGKTRPVVVLCMTGHRSPITAWGLRRAGVTDVHDMATGMVGWRFVGGPVVSGPDEGDPDLLGSGPASH